MTSDIKSAMKAGQDAPKLDLAASDLSVSGPDGVAPEMRTHLFACFDQLGIVHNTVEHRAVFTVEEGRDLKATMPGGHSKNLFLKDKRGDYFLVVAHGETRVDLVALGKVLAAKGRLSFGKPEAMTHMLGVLPGSVTPFGLVNQAQEGSLVRKILNSRGALPDARPRLKTVVLDKALLAYDQVWFHPLENTASTRLSSSDLVSFIGACGVEPLLLDCASPQSVSD